VTKKLKGNRERDFRLNSRDERNALLKPKQGWIDDPGTVERQRRAGRRIKAAAEAIVRGAQASSIFAAFIMAMGPVHAYAQDDERDVGVQERSRPEFDPQGLRFGGFNLNASAELSAQHVDNVFASEADAKSDWVYGVSPKATLSSDWSRNAVVISAGGSFPKYGTYSSEEVDTGYLSGYGRLDFGDDSQLSGTLRTSHEEEPRSDLAADSARPTPVEYDRNEAQVMAQHTLNRFRVQASASTAKYDFDGADQRFRDHTDNTLTGRVEYAISPRVRLVGEVSGNKRDYSNSPVLSSDGRTYLAGVALDLTHLIRGEFTVGRFSQDYPTGTVDGTALSSNLEWFVTGLTTVGFEAHRDVQESTDTSSSPFVDSRWQVRVDHELLRNVILHGDIGYEKWSFEPPVVQEDKAASAHAEIKYLMNPRVAVRLTYGHDRNDSSGIPDPHHDYDVNTILAGFTLRL